MQKESVYVNSRSKKCTRWELMEVFPWLEDLYMIAFFCTCSAVFIVLIYISVLVIMKPLLARLIIGVCGLGSIAVFSWETGYYWRRYWRERKRLSSLRRD